MCYKREGRLRISDNQSKKSDIYYRPITPTEPNQIHKDNIQDTKEGKQMRFSVGPHKRRAVSNPLYLHVISKDNIVSANKRTELDLLSCITRNRLKILQSADLGDSFVVNFEKYIQVKNFVLPADPKKFKTEHLA